MYMDACALGPSLDKLASQGSRERQSRTALGWPVWYRDKFKCRYLLSAKQHLQQVGTCLWLSKEVPELGTIVPAGLSMRLFIFCMYVVGGACFSCVHMHVEAQG